MTTNRKAFEAWWRKNTFYPAVHASTFNRIGFMLNAKGQYKMDRIEDDWLLWQAAEKAAVRECFFIAMNFTADPLSAIQEEYPQHFND